MIKAAFFDIDGTLVSFKTHRMPESTKRALNRLREEGILLFVSSGRHKSSMNNLDDYPFDGYVTLNGGICWVGDEIIYKHSIPEHNIESLIRYMETVERIPCVFVEEQESWMNYKDETVSEIFRLLNFPEPPFKSPNEAIGKTIYQLLAFFGKDKEKELMKVLPDCEPTRWNPLFTDIVPKGSSKRVGIMKMSDYFGISEKEIIAFGDGGNDIQMLEYAGLGIAMGNAAEEVKQSADYVTSDVDEDGIAKALIHFGLL